MAGKYMGWLGRCVMVGLLGMALPSLADTYKWNTIAFGGGGFVSGVMASPQVRNLHYLRTDVGGAYRWDPAAQGWTAILDGNDGGQSLNVYAMGLDSTRANRVWMVTGGYNSDVFLLRSDDQGKTWPLRANASGLFVAKGNGGARQLGEKLAVSADGGSVFVGSQSTGVWKYSTTAGSWSQVGGGLPTTAGVSFVVRHPARNSTIFYAGLILKNTAMVSNIYKSIDNGVSWTAVPMGALKSLYPARGAVSQNGNLYVTMGDGVSLFEGYGAGAVYKLSGTTFTDVTPTSKPWGDATTRNYSAYSGLDIRSRAGGADTLMVSSINYYGARQFWTQGNVGYGDQIYTSLDGGAKWVPQFGTTYLGKLDQGGIGWYPSNIHWAGQVAFDPFDPCQAFVTSGQGVYHATQMNLGYFQNRSVAYNSTNAAAITAGTLKSATFGGCAQVQCDPNPAIWTFAVKGIEETVPGEMAAAPGGNKVVTMWDYTGFRSTDVTVFAENTLQPASGTTQSLAMAPAAPLRFARSGDGENVNYSLDGGATWKNIAKPSSGNGGSVTLNANGTVLLFVRGAQLWYSAFANGSFSQDWALSSLEVNSMRVESDPLDARIFYVYDYSKTGNFYVSRDAGKSFQSFLSLPVGGVNRLGMTPGRSGEIWVALNSKGASLLRITGAHTNNPVVQEIGVSNANPMGIAGKIKNAGAVALGKSKVAGGYPAVFVRGVLSGPTAPTKAFIYRSDDMGVSWNSVNDEDHEFGGLGNGNWIVGDPDIHGRVYQSSFGRGVIYGDLDGIVGQAASLGFINPENMSIAENSVIVAKLLTTTGSGSAKTFAITGGADKAKFSINASSGELRLVSAPDFETPADADKNNVYQVLVQVTQGTTVVSRSLAVAVLNVNEAPLITNAALATGWDVTDVTIPENTTMALTVLAQDPDTGDSLSFRITGGYDASHFQIDAETGVLSFRTPPNFEGPVDWDSYNAGARRNNTYWLTVRVSDGNQFADRSFGVRVSDVNEGSLAFLNGASLARFENATWIDTLKTNLASSSFTIVGGSDAAKFKLVGSVLHFVAAPDFDAPGDSDKDNRYTVTVKAVNGTVSTTQTLQVALQNVNESPVLPASASITVTEGVSKIDTLVASDPDAGANLSYTLVGVNATKFSIGKTDVMSFVTAPIYVAGGVNSYPVTVVVSDGVLNDSMLYTVNVRNAVTQITSPATAQVVEGLTRADTIVAETATVGAAKTFTITGGTDAAKFSIGASNGYLSFVVAPDYETPADADANNVYQVIVTVSSEGVSASKALAVTVLNGNDAPVIAMADSVSMPEGRSAVGTVTASDLDADDVKSWSIVGGADRALFTLGENSGALAFRTAPSFTAPQDANADNVYELLLRVNDGILSDTMTLFVRAYSAPVLTISAASTVYVPENTTAVQVVSATSNSAGASIAYSIVGGKDAAMFRITSTTGALTFATAPDFEKPTDYAANNWCEVIVQAATSTVNATKTIAVVIQNVNEAPTALALSNASVKENAPALTVVGILSGRDADAGSALTYALVSGSGAGHNGNFVISNDTLFTKMPMDYEWLAVRSIRVRVSDSAGLYYEQAFTVSLLDVAEVVSSSSSLVSSSSATATSGVLAGLCGNPVMLAGAGSYTVTPQGTCFKFNASAFKNGAMMSVRHASTAYTSFSWYGGLAQTATACSENTQNLAGNGAQLNNFAVDKDALGYAYLFIRSTTSASYSMSLDVQNWQNGLGCGAVLARVIPSRVQASSTHRYSMDGKIVQGAPASRLLVGQGPSGGARLIRDRR